MEDVYFKPFIGKNYFDNGGIFKKKILVLGESHYCGECEHCNQPDDDGCKNFTNKVIKKDYLEDGQRGYWANTFRKFEHALIGELPDYQGTHDIWNSLAFYNYIQRAMHDQDERPSVEDWKSPKTVKAFYEVLNELEPDYIIGWGSTDMYEQMPGDFWQSKDDIKIEDRPYNVPNGTYQTSSGKVVPILFGYHPAYKGYKISTWNKVYSDFLNSKK